MKTYSAFWCVIEGGVGIIGVRGKIPKKGGGGEVELECPSSKNFEKLTSVGMSIRHQRVAVFILK